MDEDLAAKLAEKTVASDAKAKKSKNPGDVGRNYGAKEVKGTRKIADDTKSLKALAKEDLVVPTIRGRVPGNAKRGTGIGEGADTASSSKKDLKTRLEANKALVGK